MKKPLLVVLTGITATGKTDLALNLASKINGKVLTVDSTQLIKQISALNNKADPKHGVDLLGSIDGFGYYSVVQYTKSLSQAIAKTVPTQVPILEGGSTYYVKMLLDGGMVIFCL